MEVLVKLAGVAYNQIDLECTSKLSGGTKNSDVNIVAKANLHGRTCFFLWWAGAGGGIGMCWDGDSFR